MDDFLQKNYIEYKIIGIDNNIYKIELNDVSIYCTIYQNKKNYRKKYYNLIVYVPQEIHENKYILLTNKIKLIGIIEGMNIYKYYNEYDDVNDVINIILIIHTILIIFN